jgi:hypothetical protein
LYVKSESKACPLVREADFWRKAQIR